MNYWQWLQFQSFSRQVLEPTHKSQLEKLDEWIFEPYTKTVTDSMNAYSQTERWAANSMYGMHLTHAPRLALELLQHIGLFALGCAQEEGFTAEAKKSLWQETRRICNQLAPYLPEPDRAALLALLPVEDAAIGMPKPLPRQRAQEQAILRKLSELNYAPLQLPKNPLGKKGVKAQVKERLLQTPSLFSNSSFDKAWERLSSAGDIRIS